MQCFLHHDAAAVGICRTCGKGICPACARETASGIVCSDACADLADVNRQMVERARRLYSIGVKQKIPLGAWFFGIAGALALVIAVLLLWSDPNGWPIAAYCGGIGVLFLGFSVFTWRRYRAVGLNL